MSEASDFFVVGGTMRVQSLSYVTRPADQELYRHVLAGEFCYVLTSRQMGKSSLMVRTARQLEADGIRSIIIDLTSIGTVSVDDWYLGLLSRICSSLQLSVEPAAWWAEHEQLGPSQRFMDFLRDVALADSNAPIVIFMDEIDTTLNLDFRDDFFAAIRAMYNERASTPAYQRITFVLLGVATPTDLIQDRDRTPFNIGREIVLREFSYDDAAPLSDGLNTYYAEHSRDESATVFDPEHAPSESPGDTILHAIFAWTNGHPYLTQKLCQLVAATAPASWSTEAVDALVQEHFLAKDAPDDNLKFVQNRIQASPIGERRKMLRLYRRIHAGEAVPDDDRSQEQNYLELYGLVRPEGQQLRVRNQIYHHVFDQRWVKATMPPLASRRTAAALSAIAAFVVVVAAMFVLNRQTPAQAVVQSYIDQFNSSSSPEVRMSVLAGLFKLQQSQADAAAATTQAGGKNDAATQNDLAGQAARKLFLSIPDGEQQQIFLQAQPGPANTTDVPLVVKGLIPSLNTVAQVESDPDVMDAMGTALTRVSNSNAALADGLKSWSAGRRAAAAGNYQQAIDSYKLTLQATATPEKSNPALHYDWALALTKLELFPQALGEFNTVIVQAAADPISQPDDAGLAALVNRPVEPNRFISANRAKKVVEEQLSQNSALLAALQAEPGKFPILGEAYGPLLANLAQRQTAAARVASATAAAAAQATVTAVGGATATALGQTASAQAAESTRVAGATGTSLAIAAAATLTPTRVPTPRPTITVAAASIVAGTPTVISDLTATQQAEQTALAATELANRTATAVAALANQAATGTALASRNATQTAQANQNATATAQANQDATATAQASQDATAAALANQNATATTQANQDATAAAQANQNATATAQANQNATATAQAIANITATAQAQVPNAVTIYNQPNFAGASAALAPRTYDAGVGQISLGNDIVRSVQVPAGWAVVLYENFDFQGTSAVLTSNLADSNTSVNGVSGICVVGPGGSVASCPLNTTFAAPGGNDANDCRNVGSACQTIAAAVGKVADGRTVLIAPGTYAERLTISRNVSIIGAGAGASIIDGGQAGTVFTIANGMKVNMSNLTIQNGKGSGDTGSSADTGGAVTNRGTLTLIGIEITNNYADTGGGINNGGTLTIQNSTVANNVAGSGACTRGTGGNGGGIINSQGKTTSIINSLIRGNRSCYGAGLYNFGQMTISRTTVADNVASVFGGGLHNWGNTSVANSTFTGNTGIAITHSGGSTTVLNSTVANNQGGISIYTNTIAMGNTIVSGNVTDLQGTITSGGHNLIGNPAGANGLGASDLQAVDPKLGSLANNGGATLTIALQPGSPAINAGDGTICAAVPVGGVDQRGVKRPQGPTCDIGAYEAQ